MPQDSSVRDDDFKTALSKGFASELRFLAFLSYRASILLASKTSVRGILPACRFADTAHVMSADPDVSG